MAVVTPFGQETAIQYRLYGPDGTTVCFNTPASTDFIGYTEEVTGLDGPETRESAELIVEGDGGIHGDFFHGRRPITLSGIIDPNAYGAAQNTMISNLLRATNAMRANAVLEWTPTGGDQVRVSVRRQQPPRIAGNRVKTFQISLVAADPRIYGTAARALARASEAAPTGYIGLSGTGEFHLALSSFGPAVHLPLDASRAFTDISGNLRDGVGSGGIVAGSYTPGPLLRDPPGATTFDGINDFVTVPYKTRRNEWPNPSFETNLTGVTGFNATIAQSAGAFYWGSQSCRLTATGAGAAITATASAGAVAGQGTYTGSFYLFTTVSGRQGGIDLVYYNSGGTQIGSTTGTYSTSTAGTWTRFSTTGTAPAGTAFIGFVIRGDAAYVGAASEVCYVDAILIENAGTAGAFFPTPPQLAIGEAGWSGTANASASAIGCFADGTTRTFSGWANRDHSAGTDDLFGGTVTNPPVLQLYAGNQDVVFRPFNATGTFWTGAWPGNSQWVHWALVFNDVANTAKLYINGDLVSSQACPNSYNPSPGDLTIGGHGAAVDTFVGKMAGVGVVNGELSAAQIRYLYESGARALASNKGNADTPVLMRITGPITNPIIHNLTTGQTLSLIGPIAAGNYVDINTADGTIVNQSGGNVYGMMDFATSSWWDLKPGVNDLRLSGTGTTGATQLTLYWKDAWV